MLNSEYYPLLNTNKTIKEWWNDLNWGERVDIGGVAIHFTLMTANYRWNSNFNYEDLTKSQKKIVKTIYSNRNSKWSMFNFEYENILGMLKF